MGSSPPRRRERSRRSLPRGRAALRRRGEELSPGRILRVAAAYAAAALLLMVIAFAGLSRNDPQIRQGEVASERIVADFGYDFPSRVRTEERRALAREKVPPFYDVRMEEFEKFARTLNGLELDYSDRTEADNGAGAELSDLDRQQEAAAFVRRFLEERRVELPVEATALFLSETNPGQRKRLLGAALAELEDLYREGIIGNDPDFTGIGSYNLILPEETDGERQRLRIQRVYDAKVALRNRLAELDINDRLFNALFVLASTAIEPNLRFNPEVTRARRDEAAASVGEVVVEVPAGETLIEPGVKVSPLAFEKLARYRQEEAARVSGFLTSDPLFLQRSFLAVLLLAAAGGVLRLALPSVLTSPRRMGTLGLLVVANLLLFRLLLLLNSPEWLGPDPTLSAVLTSAAPIAFAPVTAGILLGPLVGLLTAFTVSGFYALMFGDSLLLFLGANLATLVGLFLARDIRLRANVVSACTLAGVAFALCLLLGGVLEGTPLGALGREVASALVAGALTGVAVLGILPVLEKLFAYSTDITLLEYTDFNHPLLRRMQLEAPGTYHHSLMVASLSENAAAAIGANPLVCRATALFHDVGKLVKPEYFTENQMGRENPLVAQKPSLAAVIIKRHVKEGLELARQYKLPRVFRDIIREHHGTSLIQYFYREAVQRQNGPGANEEDRLEEVQEETYRYDGPKPHSPESAIIFFADSVEAASRSLPKVNAQSIDDLLEAIFRERMEDGQLDECSLTLRQVAEIRKSFSRTLLNSLHARIAYPERPDSADTAGRNSARERAQPSPPRARDRDQQPV